MVHQMLWIFPFSLGLKHLVIPVRFRSNLDHISNMIWCWIFLWIRISLFPIAWIFMILLNTDIFDWILVLTMFLSLRTVMTWTFLHFYVSCWLGMYYKPCWTVIGYFMIMLKIQTLFLFLYGKALFNGILFFDWEIYDMLWCSQYCATMPIWVPLGGKSTLTSNISFLMKGLCDRSIYNVKRVEIFLPSMSSETGNHP